jgi:sugar phosphate isomerase/epimerase
MSYHRRDFLKLTGTLALSGMAGQSLLSCSPGNAAGNKIETFGIQLYTLRDDMPKDPKGVLQQLASFGYKQIESYEGPQGIFWGMDNTDFKKYIEDLEMDLVASHCDIKKDFERKIEDAAAIGIKYLICPWVGPQVSADGNKRLADTFNQCGELCNKAGIRFAYHNHDYSFKPADGQVPMDIYLSYTDASLVDFELDIYWVMTAGEDPEAWLKKHPNRFRLSHIKDRKKEATGTDASCTLGEGSIDFSKVLRTAKENGMQYFIVEQERYDGTTPLKAAAANAEYMKKLRI